MKKILLITVLLVAWQLSAQPDAPATGDLPCGNAPGDNSADTVVSELDEEGYFSLFNGTDFTGWWQSCQTSHSSGSSEGAIFRVHQGEEAIYTTQRGSSTGGILMTNKKFDHYELIFDTWPDYGNDAGIFHRTPPNGRCFQTVLDYIETASYGGTWGEGGYQGRDYRPFSFSGGEQTISIPGNGNGAFSNWTQITQGLGVEECPNGCTQADWQRLWDFNGWNEFKVQFYDGLFGINPIKMKTWFRKKGDSEAEWIPILHDTTLIEATPANYVGIQVHGGGRFGAQRGSWYKNIRWTPLDENGERLLEIPVGVNRPSGQIPVEYQFSKNDFRVSVDLPGKHSVVLMNAAGKTLQKKSIARREVFSADKSKYSQGVYYLQVKSGSQRFTKKYLIH